MSTPLLERPRTEAQFDTGATLDGVLAAMSSIDLDELTAQAAMMQRVDRKYLLRPAQATQLLQRLADDARVLQIAEHRAFDYASVYYDTPDLAGFRGAAMKRRRRFKVRRRVYLDSGLRYIEVKTRGGRDSTVKERDISTGTGPLLTGLERAFVQARLSDAGIRAEVDQLAPTLGTRYRRSTLLLPDGAGRLTIDTNLRWHAASGQGGDAHARAYTTDDVIVETKSGSSPSSADKYLWHNGIRPTRISKYATGLVLLNPLLPGNRWHRTLHRLRTP